MPTLKLDVVTEPADFAHALDAHAAFTALLKQKSARGSLRTLLWVLLFAGFGAVVFVPDLIESRPVALPVGIVIGLAAIHAIVLLALAVDTYLDSRKPAEAPKRIGHVEAGASEAAGGSTQRGKGMNPYIGWFVFAGVAAVSIVMIRLGGPPNPVPSQRTPAAAAVTPYGGGKTVEALDVPGAQIFLACVVATWWGVAMLGKAQGRRQARQQLEIQPSMLVPKTWEIDEAGLVERGPTLESRMTWAHLIRFVETPQVILLYPSDVMFYLFPKRAFVDEAQLAQFLALLTSHVPDGLLQPRRPGGFPVQPVPVIAVDTPPSGPK